MLSQGSFNVFPWSINNSQSDNLSVCRQINRLSKKKRNISKYLITVFIPMTAIYFPSDRLIFLCCIA